MKDNIFKIYKLCLKNNIEPKDDYKDFYGYSNLPLHIILYAYENDYKRYLNKKFYYSKAFKLFNDYGIENIEIELIENVVECNNKKQLKEKYYDMLKNIISVK